MIVLYCVEIIVSPDVKVRTCVTVLAGIVEISVKNIVLAG